MPAAAAATDYAPPADFVAGRPVEPMVSVIAATTAQDAIKLQQQHQHRQQHHQRRDDVLCDFRSTPNAAEHETFVRDAVRLMLEQAVFRGTDRRSRVLNWKSPEELQAEFDFQLDRSATTHSRLLQLIGDTIQHSVKTGHPYFVNQLFSRYKYDF